MSVEQLESHKAQGTRTCLAPSPTFQSKLGWHTDASLYGLNRVPVNTKKVSFRISLESGYQTYPLRSFVAE
jgi:hypothetical protein